MKARRKTNVRTVSRHFLGGSFFVGTLVKKKFDCQNFMEERERACGRVFEILSEVALLLSFSLPIIFYDVHDDVHDDDDARTFTLSFPLGITEQSVPFF